MIEILQICKCNNCLLFVFSTYYFSKSALYCTTIHARGHVNDSVDLICQLMLSIPTHLLQKIKVVFMFNQLSFDKLFQNKSTTKNPYSKLSQFILFAHILAQMN